MAKNEVFWRSGYNYDVEEASDASGLKCEDPSLTVQSGKEEADINTIVRNFGVTGQVPVNVRAPLDVDFVGLVDYHSALEAVRAANASFMEMPADVRAKFDNDPGRFVQFCSDPANLEELGKLGLAVAKPASEADSAPAASAPGTAQTPKA